MQSVVEIKHDGRWGLSAKFVREKLILALEKVWDKPTYVSLWFVGKKKAKELNILHRQMDYVPQVLGFPTGERVPAADGLVYLGDITVCVPLLKEEAKLYNRRLEEVLEEWLAHGVGNLFK